MNNSRKTCLVLPCYMEFMIKQKFYILISKPKTNKKKTIVDSVQLMFQPNINADKIPEMADQDFFNHTGNCPPDIN